MVELRNLERSTIKLVPHDVMMESETELNVLNVYEITDYGKFTARKEQSE